MKVVPMIGNRYGSLTVLSEISGCNPKKFTCICDCGKKRDAIGWQLRSGKSTSCGCKRGESHITHGLSSTREYKIWAGIKKRCLNKKAKNYHRYGGRGIYMCDRWINSFENFLNDMGEANGLTIERVDNNGPYSPENCRWASLKQQGRNKRSNHILEVDGISMCITEWEEFMKTKPGLIKRRIYLGWTAKQAIYGR